MHSARAAREPHHCDVGMQAVIQELDALSISTQSLSWTAHAGHSVHNKMPNVMTQTVQDAIGPVGSLALCSKNYVPCAKVLTRRFLYVPC